MQGFVRVTRKYAAWIVIGIILISWELSARLELLPQFIIPAPTEIVQALITDASNLWSHTQVTLIQTVIGLAFGIIIAFIIAVLMDRSEWVYRGLYPLLITSQTIPTVAIAPILVLLLGYDMTPKIVLVILTTLFPIVVSLLNGFAQCDEDAIQLLELMGANHYQILTKVKLPASMPHFFSGLKISVTYAFVSSVIAEWLGGFEGLGVYMIRLKNAFNYPGMFAVIVVISFVSLLLMGIVSLVQRWATPWEYKDHK